MRGQFFVCIVVSLFALSSSVYLIRKCIVPTPDKIDCGYPGIRPDNCRAKGCCYDNSTSSKQKVPWCYKATKNSFINTGVMVLMAQDGVPFDLIASLYADAYPSAEWILAFRNGGLDTTRLLEMIAGKNRINLNPLLSNILAGSDPLSILFDQIGSYSGTDSTYLKYAMSGDTQVVMKHLLSILSAKNRLPGIPYNIIHSLASGQGFNPNYLLESYASQLFPSGDKFTNEFYKRLFAGKTEEAIQWAYLAAFKDKFPQGSLYPKNSALFVSLVKTQKQFPGKIRPSTLLALAKGEIIPALNMDPPATFKQMFGVEAQDFICAAHSPNIQSGCEALRGYYYVTQKQCLDAGCCLQMAVAAGESTVCFENILGSVGVILAQTVIDEEYIKNEVLGGELISIDDFIPWVPNTELPEAYTNFINSGSPDIFAHHFPTYMPLKATDLRPNFVWKPHAPTPVPFPTRIPGDFVATEEPMKLEGDSGEDEESDSPTIMQLELNRFSTQCRTVQKKDRYECIDNSQALGPSGHDFCLSNDCCYDPIWSDLNIPVCFRTVDYGQCHEVPYEQREDCGSAGIGRTECLKNPQCCYDSAVTVINLYDEVPWCYYKLRAPVRDDNRCARSISYDERVGCFPNSALNYAISRESCEAVDGCCYEKVRVTNFDRYIGREVQPPYCYKGLIFDLAPTTEEESTIEEGEDPESVCDDINALLPHKRSDCGPKNWFACVSQGCCWDPMWNAPWCYSKSTKCKNHGPPDNGVVSPADDLIDIDDTISFTCNMGFTLIGEGEAKCGDSGYWDAAQPICV